MAKTETPVTVREPEGLPPSETVRISRIYPRWVKPLLLALAGTAAVGTVYGVYSWVRGFDPPPPKEPVPISTPYNGNHVVIPPVIGLSTPTPTAESTPAPKETPVVTPVPPTLTPTATVAKPTPTTIARMFELTCDVCTPEELQMYHKIAEDDYNFVKGGYGVENGRMVVSVSKRGGVGFDFYFEGKKGSSGGKLSDFTLDPSDRGHKHEIAHAVNYALLSKDIPSWLDEGLAMYASGEVDDVVEWSKSHDGNFFWSTVKRTEDPKKYWSEAGGFVPSHIIGTHFFGLMVLDYGLKPEQNRTALNILRNAYNTTREQPTRRLIQATYESALGLSARKLDPLFDFLKIGVDTLYTDSKIRSEF